MDQQPTKETQNLMDFNCVTFDSSQEDLDKALSVPARLTAPDGRSFLIFSWEPRVAVDETVTAEIHVVIELPTN